MERDNFNDNDELIILHELRDRLSGDVKSLDNQLRTLTGRQVKSVSDVGKRLDLVSDLTSKNSHFPPNLDGGIKRGRTEIDDDPFTSDDDDSPKLKRNIKISSVLAHPNPRDHEKDEEERRALLERQKNDKQTLDRNKRMFGMLVGTLQRFRTEETGRERLTVKRSKIEEKLEIANEEEKASTTKEVERLKKLKFHKEDLLDKAELKLDTISRFKNWEKTYKNLRGYIRTETKPKIFWLPKEHNSTTEKKLKDTKDYFSLCLAERTAKFKKEMNDLEADLKDLSKPDLLKE